MNRLERLLGISDITCLNELLSSSEIGVYHFKHLLHLTKSSIFFLSKSFYILSYIHNKTATNFRKTYKEREKPSLEIYFFFFFFANFWNFGLETEFLLNASSQQSFLTCFFHLKFYKPCLISLKIHLDHFNSSLSFGMFSNFKKCIVNITVKTIRGYLSMYPSWSISFQ